MLLLRFDKRALMYQTVGFIQYGGHSISPCLALGLQSQKDCNLIIYKDQFTRKYRRTKLTSRCNKSFNINQDLRRGLCN